jgi:pimeloyl-ACP methyl ester carboxylesterase
MAVSEIESIANGAGVDRFAWLGYSFGGAIGVQLACRTNRISAVAIGGWPPLNAPFRFMYEFLTKMSEAPPHALRHVDPRNLLTAASFYRSLIDWPERQEIAKLRMPRLVFMGDRDRAQSLPPSWSVPLAELLRAAEDDLRALHWEICWLAGQEHLSAIRPEISLPSVRRFFRHALLSV